MAIVGSGAGGAVVAAALAEAGKSVVVLEEGPLVTAEEHGRMRPSESIRRVWRDGAMGFAVGVGDSPLINVTMGRCVGGSSMLTGGVCFRTPEEVTHEWSHDMGLSELSSRKLEPYFEEVEEAVHVEEVPVAMRSRSTQLFGKGLETRGLELLPMRRNTRDCGGCGRCNFGCPRQAKLSVDLSWLPRAFAKGAQVVSDCRVDRIVVKDGRAAGVTGRLMAGARGRSVTVHARQVVVAAGAWHTPLLLRRSRIGRRSGQLGRNLTLHPGFRSYGRFAEPVRGWQGALQSAYCDAFMDEGITMVSLFVPTGLMAGTMPGFGPRHARMAAQIPNVAMFGALIHDEGGGVIRRGIGHEPWVTYRMSKRDRARIPRLIRLMAEIFFDAGALECYLPILGMEPVTRDQLASLDLERVKARNIECSSQHPLGSCRMGADAAGSVVDQHGKVWEVDGLHLADGSVIPSSLGVNPQLTIMAMALRIARGIAEQG